MLIACMFVPCHWRVYSLLLVMATVICLQLQWLILCTHTHTLNCTPTCPLPLTVFRGRLSVASLMVCLALHSCSHVSGRHLPVFCSLPCTFVVFLLNYKWINMLNRLSLNPTGCLSLPRMLFLVLRHDREWGEWTQGRELHSSQMGCPHSPRQGIIRRGLK